MPDNITLPEVQNGIPHIHSIIESLGLTPTVLADTENIKHAWANLPRQLNMVPQELRDELLARMCVATAVGLFDSAINYIWNSSIRNLRQKVKVFGYSVIKQIMGKEFNDDILKDMKDAELLTLCLKLNLITEEGFFFLDQCRDVRNNFSAAHLSIGQINDTELIAFINRCINYAISGGSNPKGVDISSFIDAVKTGIFNEAQLNTWIQRIKETHDAQREMLFGMLHGMYCDPLMKGDPRTNALNICKAMIESFTSEIVSNFINRHSDYSASGDEQRLLASQNFFEKLGLISALNSLEQHKIISRACNNLISVHYARDNFYNEPAFAERLSEIIKNVSVPDTARDEFVLTIIICYIGNEYGTSTSAIPYYVEMIKNFSPKEIQIMLNNAKIKSSISSKLSSYYRCRVMFKKALLLFDRSTIPSTIKNDYDELLKSL